MKVTVVGAGAVGASCAEYIAIKDFADEIVLVDIKHEPCGHCAAQLLISHFLINPALDVEPVAVFSHVVEIHQHHGAISRGQRELVVAAWRDDRQHLSVRPIRLKLKTQGVVKHLAKDLGDHLHHLRLIWSKGEGGFEREAPESSDRYATLANDGAKGQGQYLVS